MFAGEHLIQLTTRVLPRFRHMRPGHLTQYLPQFIPLQTRDLRGQVQDRPGPMGKILLDIRQEFA